MSAFDTFIDDKRKRVSQSKAFANDMEVYALQDKVRSSIKLRTYYVQTDSPAYFIRIEGNIFTGIVNVIEDNILLYPVFDYHGNSLKVDDNYMTALVDIAELSTIIERNTRHLAMDKLRNDFDVLRYHPVNKLAGFGELKYLEEEE